MKYNRAELVEAVSMLKDCRWSTAFAEQLHAHAAVLHKLHREYGAETLCSRAMISFLKLLVGDDPLLMKEQQAHKKLTLLDRKCPEKASGRAHFLGSFAHEAKEVAASSRTLTEEETQGHFAEGSKRWAALEPAQKRAFEASSDSLRRAKRARIEDDKAKVRSDLALLLQRSAQERKLEGVQSKVSSCRLTEPWRQRLQELWHTISEVPARRKRAMIPLGVPAPQLVGDMASVEVPQAPDEQVSPEEWCKRICKHRGLFSQTILCVSSSTRKRYYYFLFACKSPQYICLKPLEVRDLNFEASSGSTCRASDVPIDVHCSAFDVRVGGYTSGRRLALAAEEYLYVVPFAGFRLGSSMLFADLTCSMYYLDFLKGQPDPGPAQKEGSSSSRNKEQEALLKKHPWMTRALDRKRPAKPEEVVEPNPEVEEEEEEEEEEEADLAEVVMQRLSLKHPELAQLHAEKPLHFDVHMRREYGHRGTGKEADAARGVCLSSAEDFCRTHGLSMSATFSFKDCTGEVGAHRLAQEWCRRMHLLHDAYELEGEKIDWHRTIASFQLDADFEAWVTSCDSAYISQRAAQFMAIMPR